jgi:hypothetical protein
MNIKKCYAALFLIYLYVHSQSTTQKSSIKVGRAIGDARGAISSATVNFFVHFICREGLTASRSGVLLLQ